MARIENRSQSGIGIHTLPRGDKAGSYYDLPKLALGLSVVDIPDEDLEELVERDPFTRSYFVSGALAPVGAPADWKLPEDAHRDERRPSEPPSPAGVGAPVDPATLPPQPPLDAIAGGALPNLPSVTAESLPNPAGASGAVAETAAEFTPAAPGESTSAPPPAAPPIDGAPAQSKGKAKR